MGNSRLAWGALVALGLFYISCGTGRETTRAEPVAGAVEANAARGSGAGGMGEPAHVAQVAQPARKQLPPLLPFVEKGLDWLAGAQQDDGGWGAGSSARQDVRDAHAVPTDPATTAVAAMALMRAGNGFAHGDFATTLQKANDYLLRSVEKAPVQGPKITELTGTQPQAKMGQNVDTALTAQFFSRLLQESDLDASLRPRVTAALDKCLHKIEAAQSQDGSWAAGGWAPVLQSAQMNMALELGQAAGREVDTEKLAKAREYQGRQVILPGSTATTASGASIGFLELSRDAAGVPLYSSASNMRNVAAQAKAAVDLVEEAKEDGRLPQDAKVEAKTLEAIGVPATRAATLEQSVTQNTAAKVRAFDDQMLEGFGNNGGEEFLSYQMKSESLAIDGGDEWGKWMTKMNERLAKVQNPDGSWTGHHCITSPAFCTATAISCLTAERDVDWLRSGSKLAAK